MAGLVSAEVALLSTESSRSGAGVCSGVVMEAP
jgi:hypothetical protein